MMNKKMIGALLGTLALCSMNVARAEDAATDTKPAKAAKKGKGKKGGDKSCSGDHKAGDKSCSGDKKAGDKSCSGDKKGGAKSCSGEHK